MYQKRGRIDLYSGYSFAEKIRFWNIREQIAFDEKIRRVKNYGSN